MARFTAGSRTIARTTRSLMLAAFAGSSAVETPPNASSRSRQPRSHRKRPTDRYGLRDRGRPAALLRLGILHPRLHPSPETSKRSSGHGPYIQHVGVPAGWLRLPHRAPALIVDGGGTRGQRGGAAGESRQFHVDVEAVEGSTKLSNPCCGPL